jgi:hypothetical protein
MLTIEVRSQWKFKTPISIGTIRKETVTVKLDCEGNSLPHYGIYQFSRGYFTVSANLKV